MNLKLNVLLLFFVAGIFGDIQPLADEPRDPSTTTFAQKVFAPIQYTVNEKIWPTALKLSRPTIYKSVDYEIRINRIKAFKMVGRIVGSSVAGGIFDIKECPVQKPIGMAGWVRQKFWAGRPKESVTSGLDHNDNEGSSVFRRVWSWCDWLSSGYLKREVAPEVIQDLNTLIKTLIAGARGQILSTVDAALLKYKPFPLASLKPNLNVTRLRKRAWKLNSLLPRFLKRRVRTEINNVVRLLITEIDIDIERLGVKMVVEFAYGSRNIFVKQINKFLPGPLKLSQELEGPLLVKRQESGAGPDSEHSEYSGLLETSPGYENDDLVPSEDLGLQTWLFRWMNSVKTNTLNLAANNPAINWINSVGHSLRKKYSEILENLHTILRQHIEIIIKGRIEAISGGLYKCKTVCSTETAKELLKVTSGNYVEKGV